MVEIEDVIKLFKVMPSQKLPEAAIRQRLESFNQVVQNGEMPDISSTDFGIIGICTLQLIEELEPMSNVTFFHLLLEKHKRYGAHPLRVWGALGVIIRIHSKFERYLNLKDQPDTRLLDEGFMDTLRDILGYCVLGYLMVQ